MTAEKCRAKALEIEGQVRPPMLSDARHAYLAQARYLREHADRLERDGRHAARGRAQAA